MTVQTPAGLKRMDELRYGDQVRVASLETGATSYEAIKSFIQARPNRTTEFVTVYHALGGDQPLILTPTHLVFASVDGLSSPTDVTGAQLKPGMFLWVAGRGDKLMPSKVADVARELLTGFYSPMTASGTILVEGVLASTYIDVNGGLRHALAHRIFGLPRLFFDWVAVNAEGTLPEDHMTLWAYTWCLPWVFVTDGLRALLPLLSSVIV